RPTTPDRLVPTPIESQPIRGADIPVCPRAKADRNVCPTVWPPSAPPRTRDPVAGRGARRAGPGGSPAVKRLFAVLSSLRLAVVLLSLFAACLAGATVLESHHGARVAQELVYRAWWFALLLALLAANVLCAALKKYPWRRHQTGFLVTHAGLLVLLAGGL